MLGEVGARDCGSAVCGNVGAPREVGGKRFPRRGNRRRWSFCHPRRACLYRRAKGLNKSGDTKLGFGEPTKVTKHQKNIVFSARQVSFRSDQKARLSSRGRTAKRFPSREPPQGACGALRHRASASRTAGFAFSARSSQKTQAPERAPVIFHLIINPDGSG